MKRIFASLFVAAIATVVVAAEQENKNETVPAEVRKGIEKGNAQWVEAWNKADASLIASLFAKDGLLLSQNGKSFKGQDQIFEHLKPVMEGAGKGVKATITVVNVWLDGDTAYETGKYSYQYQEKDKPVTEAGRYVTIWKRQADGSWKIIMDLGIPKD